MNKIATVAVDGPVTSAFAAVQRVYGQLFAIEETFCEDRIEKKKKNWRENEGTRTCFHGIDIDTFAFLLIIFSHDLGNGAARLDFKNPHTKPHEPRILKPSLPGKRSAGNYYLARFNHIRHAAGSTVLGHLNRSDNIVGTRTVKPEERKITVREAFPQRHELGGV